MLNTNGPSTRTLGSRPSFPNSRAWNPPCVGRRGLMQARAVRSSGRRGLARPARHEGAAAMRMSGPIRTAVMSSATMPSERGSAESGTVFRVTRRRTVPSGCSAPGGSSSGSSRCSPACHLPAAAPGDGHAGRRHRPVPHPAPRVAPLRPPHRDTGRDGGHRHRHHGPRRVAGRRDGPGLAAGQPAAARRRDDPRPRTRTAAMGGDRTHPWRPVGKVPLPTEAGRWRGRIGDGGGWRGEINYRVRQSAPTSPRLASARASSNHHSASGPAWVSTTAPAGGARACAIRPGRAKRPTTSG